MDRIIFGDNQFFGINHMSEEKAQAQAERFKDSQTIISQMRSILNRISDVDIEYISIVEADNLQPLDLISGRILVAVAVKIGSTRLIDNILVDADQ